MDINFKSFSLSPSDHECQEGDLATVKNLVYDDGALIPVFAPKHKSRLTSTAAKAFPPAYIASTKFYIHEVDTDSLTSDDHKNYIAVISTATVNKVMWCNDTEAETLEWETITGLTDFKVNAITFTGRIINLIGDTEQRWAMWKGDSYQVVKPEDFKYDIELYSESLDDMETVFDFHDDFDDLLIYSRTTAATGKASTPAYGVTATGLKACLDAVDAKLAKEIEGDKCKHRHTSLAVATIRLYDGSHIMLSDFFCLGGKNNLNSIRFTFSVVANLSIRVVSSLHKHKIKINFPKCSELGSLIQGVDIYISNPTILHNIEKEYRWDSGAEIFPWSTAEVAVQNITLGGLTEKELGKEVDNLTFHRAAFFTAEEVIAMSANGGTAVDLESATDTDSPLTLDDFYRSQRGASAAHNYNGRLNIADVVEITPFRRTNVKYSFHKNYGDTTKSEWQGWIKWNDIRVPAYISSTDTSLAVLHSAVCYMRIRYVDSYGSTRTSYCEWTTQAPLPPVVMFPITDVVSFDIAISELDGSLYYKAENLKPHVSESGCWSCFFHMYNGQLSFMSNKYWKIEGESGNWWYDDPYITGDSTHVFFDELQRLTAAGSHESINRYRNSILVSEADNPFVFKASNRISVGNGSVLALAAPTQPISQGQAGQTPLVAFTSEGIYPLYVNTNDGSLAATQPGPRDVLTNPDAVLSIDDAIVFPTARGLMLYSGSQTKCITDSLRGNLFPGALPHLDNILGSSALTHKIANYAPLTNLESFLTSCQLLYNYVDQQIIVFNTSSSKALVFSLRTGAWGAMDYDFMSALNSYPEALAIGKESGNYFIVDAHNSNPPESTAFNLITRPLALGEPDTLKRISAAIVRGYFQKGHVKTAVYGSRDLINWNLINTSTNHYLRGRIGSPYKYFRVVALGYLGADETIYGVSLDASGSLTNQMR